ncbi:hypothetical protein BCR37DRAFT_377131 [Protomyces lactucae-debilis]|uniref:Secreted protein n=1 Tax=Protomyces lactucae-debilis TaxID=2754530 RepID=A0A1Y2FN75_PROLT|nr:uncharacterized protein BCR37DRAFT_377131 [Protomyces lactucae-debilis]ORY85460.1 hypothetical protein BCR37DRAFT_377131 [Protomyces lactucae-debilis]
MQCIFVFFFVFFFCSVVSVSNDVYCSIIVGRCWIPFFFASELFGVKQMLLMPMYPSPLDSSLKWVIQQDTRFRSDAGRLF